MGQAFSPIQQNWYLEAEMISYVEPENWTSISYYELEAKVGEIYQALRPSITIDGFTDPSNAERFCVGLLTNVARNTSVNTVRRVIGNGLRLEYIGGDVFAECLSEKPMYISSISFNIGRGVEPNAVYKIPQGISDLSSRDQNQISRFCAECWKESLQCRSLCSTGQVER